MHHGQKVDNRWGAAAGAVAIVVFLAGALVLGDRPSFDASGAELGAWYGDERRAIQVSCLLSSLSAALLVWFLATVVSIARNAAAAVAFGTGVLFMALFLADVTTMAVGAMRPVEDPAVAAALQDFELLAMAMAAPSVSLMLAALSRAGLWSPLLARLGVAAAVVYLLRAATLLTDRGPIAPDGALGLYLPVGALALWIFAASVNLAQQEWRLARAHY